MDGWLAGHAGMPVRLMQEEVPRCCCVANKASWNVRCSAALSITLRCTRTKLAKAFPLLLSPLAERRDEGLKVGRKEKSSHCSIYLDAVRVQNTPLVPRPTHQFPRKWEDARGRDFVGRGLAKCCGKVIQCKRIPNKILESFSALC